MQKNTKEKIKPRATKEELATRKREEHQKIVSDDKIAAMKYTPQTYRRKPDPTPNEKIDVEKDGDTDFDAAKIVLPFDNDAEILYPEDMPPIGDYDVFYVPPEIEMPETRIINPRDTLMDGFIEQRYYTYAIRVNVEDLPALNPFMGNMMKTAVKNSKYQDTMDIISRGYVTKEKHKDVQEVTILEEEVSESNNNEINLKTENPNIKIVDPTAIKKSNTKRPKKD